MLAYTGSPVDLALVALIVVAPIVVGLLAAFGVIPEAEDGDR